MSKQTQLIPVEYSDLNNGICLTNYADTVVYSDDGSKTLCAIRIGGYPEQVEAMAHAINGGGSVSVHIDEKYIVLKSLTKRYRKKTSHDGVYAEATLIAADDITQSEKAVTAKENDDEDSEEDEEAEIQDLPPRSCYIYVAPGDTRALYDAIDGKTSVPLIPEFADYLIAELKERGYLKPLCVLSASSKFEAWGLKCAAKDKNIIAVIEDGLRSGAISIPGSAGTPPMPEVKSVTEYLTTFGPHIAERIKSLFVPMFDPAQESLSPEVIAVNDTIREKAGYSLYDAQLAVAEAIKRQLEHHKAGLIIAECGAGKTKIGLAAIAAATSGLLSDQKRRRKAKTFNIVLCPAHVAEKWCREIAESLPNTSAAIVTRISGFDRLYEAYVKGDKSVYAIISKETARDGYMRAPAVTRSKLKKAFICPDCGKIAMMDIADGGPKYKVNADQFFFKNENRANHKCAHCGSSLWTALNPNRSLQQWVKIGGYGFVYRPQAAAHLNKTKNTEIIEKIHKIIEGTHKTAGAHRKYPLSTYIKKRYKSLIDGVIVDELHQYSNDSGQGDAMAEIYGAARKVVGMTATLINGYASGIFYLLYRLVPGLMEADGQSHSTPLAFSHEYGVTQNVYEVPAGSYNANRRSVKIKKGSRRLPGVSPLVYSRFLLEHAAFLLLTDMGKDLPEYEEIPVGLQQEPEVKAVYDEMQAGLKSILRSDKKAAMKILSAYLNLLTAYPDQSYDQPPIYHPITGNPIVIPPDIGDIETLTAKDRATLDICKYKISEGEHVLIYTNWTRLDSQQRRVAKVAPHSMRFHSLSGIHIEAIARDSTLRLTATDFEMSIRVSMPATVERAGDTVINAKMLLDILGKFPGEEVYMELRENHQLYIGSGSSNYLMSVYPGTDFPRVEMPMPGETVMLTGISSLINNTVFAAGQNKQDNSSKPELCSVNFVLSENGIRAVAMDGYRLAETTGDPECVGDFSMLLTANAMKTLASLANDTDVFEIGVTGEGSGKYASFFDGTLMFSARIVNGKYVDTDSVFNKFVGTVSADIDSAALRNAVENVAAFATVKNQLELSLSNGELTLRSETADGNASATVATMTQEVSSCVFYYAPKRLSDCVKTLRGTVTMKISNEGMLHLRCGKTRYLQLAERKFVTAAPVAEPKAKTTKKPKAA